MKITTDELKLLDVEVDWAEWRRFYAAAAETTRYATVDGAHRRKVPTWGYEKRSYENTRLCKKTLPPAPFPGWAKGSMPGSEDRGRWLAQESAV